MTKNKAYIHQIGTALPENYYSQDLLAKYMMSVHSLPHQRLIQKVFNASLIDGRYSVINDMLSTESNYADLSVSSRMDLYKNHIVDLSEKAILSCLQDVSVKEVTHLIFVSCTGMYAPGPDVTLVKRMGFNANVKRTNVTFMGCFAAFTALKIAKAFALEDKNHKVLVVCAELCTLHFNQRAVEDQFLANTLFADGAAACLISQDKGNWCLSDFDNRLIEDSEEEMSWELSENAFEMVLTRAIPQKIQKVFKKYLDEFLQKNNERPFYYAIHPGGRKILDNILSVLQLEEKQISASYRVLKNYGNMSSPTILFVLHEILKTCDRESILMSAFGPGLSIELGLITYETN